jgi:hypothetical protein
MRIDRQNQMNNSSEKQAVSLLQRFLLALGCFIIAFQLSSGNLPEKIIPALLLSQFTADIINITE